MLIETFLSCLSSKNSCSPILQLHRSMVVFCCHLVLDNLVFFPFACLFVVVVFFHTLLVCNFLYIYLFLDGLSHEKQLINAYAKSNSHSPFFWDKTADILYLYVCMQCLHISTGQMSNNIVIMLIWKKTPIASIYRVELILNQKRSQMNFSCIWIILLAHCK